MTDNTSVITSWLEGLAARGVSVKLRNGRLWLQPARAYRELTDDELLVLRHHRAAIKQVVREGWRAATSHQTEAATIDPEPAMVVEQGEPQVEPCHHCGQPPAACAALAQNNLAVWRALHGNDPREVERRSREATAVMLHTLGHGDGITRW